MKDTFPYDDKGDNCLECDSNLEPHKYVCTVCTLSYRYEQLNHEQS